MRGAIAALTILVVFSSGGCKEALKTVTNEAANLSAAAGGTRQETVTDPAYNMTAFTLEVPADWKFAGMILRPGGCHPPPTPSAGLSYTEQSPNGDMEVVGLPGVSWSWTSNGSNALGPKCPSTTDINSAAGLLLNIAIPHLHPDAKQVTVLPLPQNIVDAIAAQNQKLAATVSSYGLRGTKQFVDAARVHVDYEQNGQAMEEMEFTIVDCMESPMMGMPGGAGRAWSKGYTRRTCSSRGTSIRRAPKGRLDALLSSTKAPQINPEWDQRVIQDMKTRFAQFQAASDAAFKQNLANFKAQGDARLAAGRVFQQNLQDSTNRAMAADSARQNAIDDSAHRTALYSLDQQEFRNPSTGEIVRASNQYNHQWMSSDGTTLIQTDDHTFDPNGQVYPVSQSWTALVPK
jgi:hypothetical protein